MTITNLTKDIDDVKRELEEMKTYKERYESLEAAQPPDYSAAIAAVKKDNQKQKDFAKTARKNEDRVKKENDLYEAVW